MPKCFQIDTADNVATLLHNCGSFHGQPSLKRGMEVESRKDNLYA